MSGPEPHPSFLQLDRVALGEAPGAAVAAHLAGCPACSAHLDRRGPATPVPGWARALASPRRSPRWTSRWSWAGVAAGAVALASLVAIPMARAPRGTTAKGAPALALHVQRGAHIALWDGRAPLEPGDRLQLEIAAPGYRHVAVALRGPGGWQPLYRGEVIAEGGLVPESWRLDGAPGPETLGVVLSRSPLSDAALAAALDHGARDERTWTTVLTLPKQPGGAR